MRFRRSNDSLARLLLGCILFACPAQAQWVERGAKIAGTGASRSDTARQGSALALSADGTTAIEGGPYDDNGRGAAWVFTRSGNTWVQQGAKLSAADSIGERVFQGRSVALSADGNTALIGGDGDSDATGAAWVFTRADGVWTEQAKLTGSGAAGKSGQGSAVGLSADGNTALIGGMSDGDGAGAAWVFTRANGIWTQQGAKLTGSGAVGPASQGHFVALAADGNTALIGGSTDDHNQGAVWIFTRSGDAWTQQGNKLVGSESAGPVVYRGYGAALSGDGNTAVTAGYGDDHNTGAAWIFVRSGDSWTQQGGKLVGAGASGSAQQGYSAALSSDGNRLLLGGPSDAQGAGAAWEFRRENGAWTQVSKLAGSGPLGKAQQGYAVALSGDGSTAMVGGVLDRTAGGAIWTFADPVLDIAMPASAAAGAPLTITVTARDADGNPASGYAGTVHFTSSDEQAILPSDAPLTHGVGTFIVTFKNSGPQNLAATDTVISKITASADVLVSQTAADLRTVADLRTPAGLRSGLGARGPARRPIGVTSKAQPAPTDYISTVLSTNPIVYFRLEAASDTSQVNGYTSTFQGGATLASPGAPICEPNNHNVSLDGQTGSVTTSLSGGITTAGTMAAWVNLAELPSSAGHFLYVAGESHSGNDFDIQFTTDNAVRFYVSDNAINIGYVPNPYTLIGQWHMIAATFDSSTNTENLYWDGGLVGSGNNIAFLNKTTQFNIGASTVFTGRNFAGGIDEVVVWNYALTAAQITSLYNSTSCTAVPLPDSETIHVTDSVTLLLSLPLPDNEKIHVTDSVNLSTSPLLPDNETIHVTDTVKLLTSLLLPDNETIHVTDSVNLATSPLLAATTNVNPPNAGTVTGGGMYASGATATFTATANPGFVFASFSGSVPTTSANPLQVTVTGPLTIVANFTPLEPALAVAILGPHSDSPETVELPVTITNAGRGPASNAQIVSVTATVLTGTGSVSTLSGVPSSHAALAPGAFVTVPVVLNWPTTAERVSLKFSLNATDALGNSRPATQTVTIFR